MKWSRSEEFAHKVAGSHSLSWFIECENVYLFIFNCELIITYSLQVCSIYLIE